MVLWLEEAVIEAAMILSVVVGSIALILATWSALAGWLRPAKPERAPRDRVSPAGFRSSHDPGHRAV
jgi:hypothetical protein